MHYPSEIQRFGGEIDYIGNVDSCYCEKSTSGSQSKFVGSFVDLIQFIKSYNISKTLFQKSSGFQE